MVIKTVKINELKPHPKNPRVHPDSAIEKLERSIKEFGWTNPILVSKDGYILAGHARLKAAEKAGISEVPVIYLPLEGAKAEAYLIADNRLQDETDWDYEKLKDLLQELDTGELDLELTGFDIEEIEDLMTQFHVPEEIIEGEVPEPPEEPITKPGDLWMLGRHRLLCGDATVAADVERLMGGEKAEAIITDPPYGINLDTDYSGMVNREGVAGKKHRKIKNDDTGFDPGFIFAEFNYCKEIFLFGADYYAEKLLERNQGSWLVWDKRVEEKFDKVIGSAFELIWSRKKRKREILRHEYSSWGARMEGAISGSKPHPTMKPVSLMADLVRRTEGTILDLFGGSGSTLIACEQLNRTCYMMEIDPVYCDVIVKRWENLTGQKAVLAE